MIVANCRPSDGELRLSGLSECELNQLVNQLESTGVKVEREKPTKATHRPLGIPVLNYDSEQTGNSQQSVAELNRAVARSTKKGIPVPRWEWSDNANESVLVNN